MNLNNYIRDIPDFPKPGIIFKDISPLLANGKALQYTIDEMLAPFENQNIAHIVGIESRGFIFAAAMAAKIGAGFIPIRKPGKLPFRTHSETYDLEYGSDAVEIHEDAIKPGENVIIVDDLLATGGTVSAAINLLRKLDVNLLGASFLIELEFLKGRQRLNQLPAHVLLRF